MLGTILSLEQKIAIMSLSGGSTEKYKQMVDAICLYSPQETKAETKEDESEIISCCLLRTQVCPLSSL